MLQYRVDFKPGGFTAEEVRQNGAGSADAVVIVSIMRGGKPAHSGSVSFGIVTADSVGYEENKPVPEIPITELYQAMTMLAHSVSEDETAPLWQRAICHHVMDETRRCVTGKTEFDELANKMINSAAKDEDDDEEMAVGFGLIDGRIIVSFKNPVDSIGLRPEDAKRISRVLGDLADQACRPIPVVSENN